MHRRRFAAQAANQVASWRGEWQGAELEVVLVARGHTIPDGVQESQPWWQWGNTTTDAYLFSWTSDRQVDLVVDFRLESGRPTARVYFPTNAQARAGIHVAGDGYVLAAGMAPALVIWPRTGEWLIDGAANFDLEAREADPVTGQIKWLTSVGSERPGIPKWVTREVMRGIDEGQGYPHFEAAMRMDASVPYEMAAPFMPSWPYLSVLDKKGTYDPVQPIYFDPVGRSMTMTWAGFHTAGQYQINSISHPPAIDFEAPFAFYRFDSRAGLQPNMVIRSDLWPADDPFGPPPANVQRTAVRMSWTGESDGLWRYSLTAAGNHVPDSQVVIGSTVVNAVPYQEFPSWLAGRSWKAVTFVEATAGEPGSEGIYDYSVEDNYALAAWINGTSAVRPPDYESPYLTFATIDPRRLKEGFRGEYSLAYDREPRLYFSPIDRRVHLLFAQGGVWNLGNGQILRTHNLDGSAFVNGWTRERVPWMGAQVAGQRAAAGEVLEALYSFDKYLIYSGPEGAQIVELDAVPETAPVALPVDGASWKDFLGVAEPGQSAGQAPDMRAWLSSFGAKGLSIPGGSINAMRTVPGGFRFALELPTGFDARTAAASAGMPVSDLKPGRYAVTYRAGRFSVEAMSPAKISASMLPVLATELSPAPVKIALRNAGAEDLYGSILELWATSPDGSRTLAMTRTVSIPGQTAQTVQLSWAPSVAGRWTLQPLLSGAGGDLTELPTYRAAVSAITAGTDVLVRTSTSGAAILPAAAGLVLCALLAAVHDLVTLAIRISEGR